MLRARSAFLSRASSCVQTASTATFAECKQLHFPGLQRYLRSRRFSSLIEPATNGTPEDNVCKSDLCGFTRADMHSPRKKLKFKCHDAHVFVGTGPLASSSDEADWGKRFERTSIGHIYHQAVKVHKPVKIKSAAAVDDGHHETQIKVSACDAPKGTVFIFPHWLQFSK
jgi:hypothetical protein